jgi:hypothetical protein
VAVKNRIVPYTKRLAAAIMNKILLKLLQFFRRQWWSQPFETLINFQRINTLFCHSIMI